MRTPEEVCLESLGYQDVRVIKRLPSFTRQVSRCIAVKEGQKCVVIKYHKHSIRRILTDYVVYGFSLIILRPVRAYVSEEGRIRGEIVARKILKKNSICTPELIYPKDVRRLTQSGYFIVEEYVDAEPLTRFVEEGEATIIEDVGYRIGEKTASLHKQGYAFGDNRAPNTLVKLEGDIRIYKVDHEYFCWDPYKLFQILDIVLVTWYPGIPESFADSFFKGYRDAGGFEALGVSPHYFKRASYLLGKLLSLPLLFIKRFE